MWESISKWKVPGTIQDRTDHTQPETTSLTLLVKGFTEALMSGIDSPRTTCSYMCN